MLKSLHSSSSSSEPGTPATSPRTTSRAVDLNGATGENSSTYNRRASITAVAGGSASCNSFNYNSSATIGSSLAFHMPNVGVYAANGGPMMSPRNNASGKGKRYGLQIAAEDSDADEDTSASITGGNLRDTARDGNSDFGNSGDHFPVVVAQPANAVMLAAASTAVVVASATTRESLVQWRKPPRLVLFRDWYISRHCNEQQVQWISKIQKLCLPLQPLIVRYFQMWSLTGEAEFYMLFIPTVVWLGTPLDGVQVASLLCVSQYVTGTAKDAVCCPRPPCPPLQLYGKRSTHDKEYGFPSTHSSHSGVFSFFAYCQLLQLFPDHGFLCWLAAVFYFANVSFSRIYLGMHWMADLLGGWAVAFLSILFHVAFLDKWERFILERKDPPWWAYVLVYVTLHIFSIIHATPHDRCPCYVDSLRFIGVMLGATVGFWAFFSRYGTLAARPKPENAFETLFSFNFFVQWVVCVVIVFVSKEVSSVVAGFVLEKVFKFLSGAYAARLPKRLQRPYLLMAEVIGLTTVDNERGPHRYIPYTANNSFAFMQNEYAAEGLGTDGLAGTGSRRPSHIRTDAEVVMEDPDGYLTSQQVWSLRTHRHWWLWEVHKRTVSYAVTGFVISFVCQVLLREGFGVGNKKASAHVPTTRK